jgi:putative flavoprotein involved in K+ transport
VDDSVTPPHRFAPTVVPEPLRLAVDLTDGRIRTIIWATGFRPDHSWLDVPVLDAKGMVRHDGGVADSPGMYVLGLPFLRRRKSSLITGAGDDAQHLADHLVGHLAGQI